MAMEQPAYGTRRSHAPLAANFRSNVSELWHNEIPAGEPPKSSFEEGLAEMNTAVREALNPKTLMTRAILVALPAVVMCCMRFGCAFFHDGCSTNLRIEPRNLHGLLLGVPLAPFTHLTNQQLLVDLLGWCCMSWSMTAYGTKFFVLSTTFLAAFSGILTWMAATPECAGLGTNGVLFGIFAFHLCILPFRRPIRGTDIASFVLFDVVFGGIWWFKMYHLPGASPCLSAAGFLGGVVFAWIFFRILQEDLENGEHSPLLGSGLKRAEQAVDAAAVTGLEGLGRGLGEASDAASSALQTSSDKVFGSEETLQLGDTVEVHSLAGEQRFNGLTGKVDGFQNQNIQVNLSPPHGGIAVLPTHLRLVKKADSESQLATGSAWPEI